MQNYSVSAGGAPKAGRTKLDESLARHARDATWGTSDVATEASALHARGLWIVPCDGKKPTLFGWPDKRLSPDELRSSLTGTGLNIAIALNRAEFMDVECDGDLAEAALRRMFGGSLPQTPTYRSSRGHHRLFRRPQGLPPKANIVIEGVEFRIGNGKGALSVVPPSVHPDGTQYEWLPGFSIFDVEPAELPAPIVARLITQPAKAQQPPSADGDIPEGRRGDTLFRMACSMRSAGFCESAIGAALAETNERHCMPPIEERRVRDIAKSAAKYDPATARAYRGDSLIPLISLSPPVLCDAALPGLVGEFVRAVEPYLEATPAGILAHLLPAVAAMIGSGPTIWGGGDQPARLNVALVGPTSTGRKGTSFVPVNMVMGQLDVIQRTLWQKACVRGLSSGEGLIQRLATEKDCKSLFVLEAEFSKVLAHARREGNILTQIMRECFDSGNLSVLTKANPLHVRDAHVCIVGHITKEELVARFREVDMANGFGNRFMWAYVKSSSSLPDAPPMPDRLLTSFGERLSAVLAEASKRRRLERDEEAGALWRAVYPYLKAEKPGLTGAMLARGEAIVLRLALIYTLLDECHQIRRPHLEAALAFWRYSEQSIELIFGTAGQQTGNSLADKLYELLGGGPLATSEFYRHVAKPAQDIQAALTYLESLGRVRKTKVVAAGPGRPAERWERAKSP